MKELASGKEKAIPGEEVFSKIKNGSEDDPFLSPRCPQGIEIGRGANQGLGMNFWMKYSRPFSGFEILAQAITPEKVIRYYLPSEWKKRRN